MSQRGTCSMVQDGTLYDFWVILVPWHIIPVDPSVSITIEADWISLTEWTILRVEDRPVIYSLAPAFFTRNIS